jgi:regulator of nucleoside diphosphate kinase
MPEAILPVVNIPAPDHVRLTHLAVQAMQEGHPGAQPLLVELHRATICGVSRPDVVELNRTVAFRSDLGWPRECRLLVCPEDYRDPAVHLSVLSPLGVALLGLRVGARFPYRTIDGQFHIAIVEGVDEPIWDGPQAA